MSACSAESAQTSGEAALSPAVGATTGSASGSRDVGSSTATTMSAAKAAMGTSGRNPAPGAAAAPAAPMMSAPASAGTTPPGMPGSAPPAAPAADSDEADAEGGSARPGGSSIQSGLLTAGAWDDNRNFDRFKRYRARLLQAGLTGALSTTDDEHEAAHDRFTEPRASRQQLDISLVVDTTGSMGDEIAYLQSEFLALSRSIEELYPDSDQRWSLVVYRDKGDPYVTRPFDFESDVAEFRDQLAAQSAGGGGDFPEAPDAAFEAMAKLGWRSEADIARLVFWVADAPHHEQNAEAMTEAIQATADLDIHVYPVASSGIDDLTELSMRSAAQLTGGRYLFLTDDSGVGGEHQEPTIPCYFVTRLDQAILRMVSIELSGEYREPVEADIIRTGGDPKSGRCQLDSGEEVQSF